jgi:hypothetical protein
MKTYFIQKRTTKYEETTFLIMERNSVEYNGVKGFANEETGYEYNNLLQAESKMKLMQKLNEKVN